MKDTFLQLFSNNRVMAIALLVAMVFLQYELWLGQGGVATIFHLNHKINEQMAANTTVAKENKILVADIHDLKVGEQSTEARARDRLGMIRSDETYYQFIQ